MSFMTHWHRDALEADNYLVFEPGDAQVQQIGLHLATQGRVTFADDDAVGIADYLRQRHGWTAIKPGETALQQHLLAEGYIVFRAGQEPLMADHLTAHGWIVHRTIQGALKAAREMLHALGFRIFPPREAPEVDTMWKPTRGQSAARLVMQGCVPGHVWYLNLQTQEYHTVTLATWHKWRTEARARRV